MMCLNEGGNAVNHPNNSPLNNNLEQATLGGGCFWCLEAVYENVQGVENVMPGYTGGSEVNPTYEQVCTGATGHAEVIQVTFDPTVIRYKEILEIFFAMHDPTTLNRQGNDVGPQYRSAIFYHSPEQKQQAQATMRSLEAEGIWDRPIVTELSPLDIFYPAEAHHREYFRRNPSQPYCQFVIAPKVATLRKRYADKLKVT